MAIAANLVTVLTAKTDGFDKGMDRARAKLDDMRAASQSRLEEASGRYAAAQPADMLLRSERELQGAIADARQQEEKKALRERLTRMSQDADKQYAAEEARMRQAEQRKMRIRLQAFQNAQREEGRAGAQSFTDRAVKFGVVTNAISGGMELVRASIAAMRGDIPALEAALNSLPLGVGRAVASTRELMLDLMNVTKREAAHAQSQEAQKVGEAAREQAYSMQAALEAEKASLTLSGGILAAKQAELELDKNLEAIEAMRRHAEDRGANVSREYWDLRARAQENYNLKIDAAIQKMAELEGAAARAANKINEANEKYWKEQAAQADKDLSARFGAARLALEQSQNAAIQGESDRMRAELQTRQEYERKSFDMNPDIRRMQEARQAQERANLEAQIQEKAIRERDSFAAPSPRMAAEVDTAFMSLADASGSGSPMVKALNDNKTLLADIKEILAGRLNLTLGGAAN